MNAPERPYAAQTWSKGVLDGCLPPGAALEIVCRDLAADARVQKVTGPVELWEHQDGRKGLFAGDTSTLPEQGWTKVATL